MRLRVIVGRSGVLRHQSAEMAPGLPKPCISGAESDRIIVSGEKDELSEAASNLSGLGIGNE
jgi:hypothetical protein